MNTLLLRFSAGVIVGFSLLFMPVAVHPAAHDVVKAFRDDTDGQGAAALALARAALDYYCHHHEPLPLPPDLPPLLRERGAVFVSTMDTAGAPRCCMGTLIPREPTLAQEIISNACAAAAHDKRFRPIKPSELHTLRLIVSIIGESHPIGNPLTLNPVIDGLAVRGPRETGVVLPGETGKAETMVRWGSIRAGIKPGDQVTYLRLDAVRFIEPPLTSTKEDTP